MKKQITVLVDGRAQIEDDNAEHAKPGGDQEGTNLMFALVACGVAIAVIGLVVAAVVIKKTKRNGGRPVNNGNINSN